MFPFPLAVLFILRIKFPPHKSLTSIFIVTESVSVMDIIKPFMPTGAFNICCPRDCVSRTANVERNGGHKWVMG